MKSHEKRAIILTASCHGVVHILELTYGAVLVSIAQEFGATLLVMGVLANIMGFAIGFSGLPAGFLADRSNERRLLAYCSLGMAASAIAIGISSSIYVLGGGLLVLGLALGLYHPVSLAYIARVVSKRAMGMGYVGMGGNLGVALGPFLGGAIASGLGWRAPYLLFSIPALLLAVLFFVSARGERNAVHAPEGPRAVSVSSSPLPLLLGMVFMGQILNGLVYRGTVTFLPAYLGERVQISLAGQSGLLLAGSFTTIALLFGVAGQYFGGLFSEKRGPEILTLVVAASTTPLLLLMGNSAGLSLMAASIGFAFFYFMGQPVYNILVANYSPANWRGRMYGLSFFINLGLGSFSASLLGWAGDYWGMNWVFIVSGFFTLVTLASATVLVLLARRAKRAGEAPPRGHPTQVPGTRPQEPDKV